jgi:hypothetical protein
MIAEPLHLLPFLLDEGPFVEPDYVHFTLVYLQIRSSLLDNLNLLSKLSLLLKEVLLGLVVARALLNIPLYKIKLDQTLLILLHHHLPPRV